MSIDRASAIEAARQLMSAVGLDPADPVLVDTPRRVADSWIELFAGIDRDPVAALGGGEPIEGAYPGPVAVTGVPFSSICEHHLLPFNGTVDLVYLPDRTLAGIGDVDAMVRVLAARPQMQERLTDAIAHTTERAIAPLGVLVRVQAQHACMWARGERTVGATVRTLAGSGRYAEGPDRVEALSLMGSR